jgi:hypothetical protein
VDAESAAHLLPLWQLLQGLSTSGSASPEEITAVVEEIQLNMTSSQLSAIGTMQLASGWTAGPAQSSKSSATTTSSSAAQVAAGADTAQIMGDMGAGAPPDGGGGPMPSDAGQSTSSSSSKSSTTAAPAAIKQVIQLLQSKVQS